MSERSGVDLMKNKIFSHSYDLLEILGGVQEGLLDRFHEFAGRHQDVSGINDVLPIVSQPELHALLVDLSKPFVVGFLLEECGRLLEVPSNWEIASSWILSHRKVFASSVMRLACWKLSGTSDDVEENRWRLECCLCGVSAMQGAWSLGSERPISPSSELKSSFYDLVGKSMPLRDVDFRQLAMLADLPFETAIQSDLMPLAHWKKVVAELRLRASIPADRKKIKTPVSPAIPTVDPFNITYQMVKKGPNEKPFLSATRTFMRSGKPEICEAEFHRPNGIKLMQALMKHEGKLTANQLSTLFPGIKGCRNGDRESAIRDVTKKLEKLRLRYKSGEIKDDIS